MNYQQALDFLMSLTDWEAAPAQAFAAERFDLARVRSLLARLGNPHLGPRTVHVAGSKGKGSVAAMIASVLRQAGARTGLYTSPHLHRLTERIAVDGEPISREELARLTAFLRPAVGAENAEAAHGLITTFEALTALAFLYFREREVQWQVLEVGLGGRLDATNVLEHKEVCVIAPISLEHTAILGDTIPQIAAEKAAIITPGATVIMGPQRESAAEVIRRFAADRGARLLEVAQVCALSPVAFSSEGQDFRLRTPSGDYKLHTPLLGRHQLENAATAVLAVEALRDHGVEVDETTLRAGLASVRWPARGEVLRRRPLVVVDGAHNADSARRLRETLVDYLTYDRAILVVGVSADKDVAALAAEMEPLPRLHQVIACRSQHPRAAAAAQVAAVFQEREMPVTWEEDVPKAMDVALSLAEPGDLVCVFGSLFVAAEARAHLLGIEADLLPVGRTAAAP